MQYSAQMKYTWTPKIAIIILDNKCIAIGITLTVRGANYKGKIVMSCT